MKQFILAALMLVIMGQRWDMVAKHFLTCKGEPTSTATDSFVSFVVCEQHYDYQRVYVIGERTPWTVCAGIHARCWDDVEKFTIPVPGEPLKTMTAAEAEKLNKELMR